MDSSRAFPKRLLAPALFTLFGAGVALWLVPNEIRDVQTHLLGFPDADAVAHWARPWILGLLCFLPALASLLYLSAGTMARYLTRQFLGIFGICFGLLLIIWLLQDLTDNLSDLRSSKHVLRTTMLFYLARLPYIVRELLPFALLLSLLYCLGKFSRAREIVAMLQTGRSLPRIVAPLIVAGLFATVSCMALNYHWAPVAEGSSDEILQRAKGAIAAEASNVLYRNSNDRRLWMVGTFPKNYEHGEPLLNVEVTTTRPDQTLESRLTAKTAKWDRELRTWTFEGAYVGAMQPDHYPLFKPKPETIIKRWSETPFQLIKPGLAAAYLGIPDLNSWLHTNIGNQVSLSPARHLTQWHYRWAQPVVCLVTVLLAAPLGIFFSRHGSSGGVAAAIGLSMALIFLTTVSLTFGEAGLISPVAAAWLPNVLFAWFGFYLFYRRIVGRPIYQSILRLFPGSD